MRGLARFSLLGVGLLLLALMAVSPWAVPGRDFDGAGLLYTPFGSLNLSTSNLPPLDMGWVNLMFWIWGALIVAAGVVFTLPQARSRSRGLLVLGLIGLGLFVVQLVLFYLPIQAVNQAALAEGISPRRLPFKRYALSLGPYLGVIFSLALLLLARLQQPGGLAFLVRLRGLVVPLVSLLLSVLLGGVVVSILKPGLGTVGQNLSSLQAFTAELDLVTYTYQLLFSPMISLNGWFDSLVYATPLIFTGLAVAFGFRAGLFNIGAPGQIIVGAIAAMLVGVYMPGPSWLVLPLTVLAAAFGGGLWGAIPGWLKARFGAHEVINTIMLNYVASSLLILFLSEKVVFFGVAIQLPFKADGLEARSQLLREEAHLPKMIDLLVVNGQFSFALPLAMLAGLLVYFLWRADLGRRLLGALGAAIVGFALGRLLPGPAVEVSSALSSYHFNASFLIATLALLFYHFFLFRTAGGYELRALGLAPRAAEYAGVNTNQKMVLAMAISGALAGLTATHYVQGSAGEEYRLKQNLPSRVGFDGIAVALMGQNTPIGILLSSVLFGVFLAGGLQINLQLGINPQLITTLQSAVVYIIAIGGLLPRYFVDPLKAAQIETEARSEVKQ